MRAKRPDTRYNGVFVDAQNPKNPYRAWIKTGSKLIQLGYFATVTEAVLAADFARFAVWGPDPTKWYVEARWKMSKPPNAAPVRNLPFDREIIMRKLLAHKVISPMALLDNVTAYDTLAVEVEKALAHHTPAGNAALVSNP